MAPASHSILPELRIMTERETLTASHWGLFYALTKDGRLTGARPFEKDCAPSPNLEDIASLPYAEARILEPMVRWKGGKIAARTAEMIPTFR